MSDYYIRRLLLVIPTLLGTSFLIFGLTRLLPGDVVILKLQDVGGPYAEANQEILRHKLGLDEPIYTQYFKWLGGVVRGDFGVSLWRETAVFPEIMDRLEVTVELAILAFMVALVIAIPAGVASAVWQDTPIDYVARFISVLGVSVPNFWLGTLFLLLPSLWFGWIPPIGFKPITEDPSTNLQQFAFPAIAVGAAYSATLMRMVRSSLLEVLRQDYVRTARSKGLAERSVILRHALRNSLIPVVTLAGAAVGGLLAGTVIIENIFALPGMGNLLIGSISARDYPIIQGVVLIIVTFYVLLNLLVDVLYSFLDPRIRYGR